MAAYARTHWPRWWLLSTVAVLGWFEANDSDLGFHLATGRAILRAGRIPDRNVLSFSEPEQPWLLHQGLPALLFEWLWQHTGALGLWLLKLALLVATWAFVYAAARIRASPHIAAGTCLVAAAVSAFRFELRPYLFTHLALAVIVWLICRLAAEDPPRYPALLAAATVATACQLHAGAIDSVIVLGLFAVGSLLARVTISAETERRALRRDAISCGLGAVLGVLTAALCLCAYHPHGARVLLFPFEMAAADYWGEHLLEFRRAWRLPLSTLWPYWLWLAAVLYACVRLRGLHLGLRLCALAYAALSLWYARMVFAFAIVSTPVLVTCVQAWTARAGRLALSPPRAALGLYLAGLFALTFGYQSHHFGSGFSAAVWPSEAFAFVRNHELRGRAFVSDAWAGPFLGEFYPERLSFFDNRLEAYSEGFARDVYQHVRYGMPGWEGWLDRYQIEFLILRYTTPGEDRFNDHKDNLRQQLLRSGRYELVFFDDFGELFVRRQGVNSALARERAIVGVDPDRRRFLGRPAAAAESLLRAAEGGMHSETALGLTALALADAGDRTHAVALAEALRARAPDDGFTRRVTEQLSAQVHP